jgi:hypothetical protein
MCLSGDARPHFTTIAAFIAQMKDTIEPLFTQVLMICDEQSHMEDMNLAHTQVLDAYLAARVA